MATSSGSEASLEGSFQPAPQLLGVIQVFPEPADDLPAKVAQSMLVTLLLEERIRGTLPRLEKPPILFLASAAAPRRSTDRRDGVHPAAPPSMPSLLLDQPKRHDQVSELCRRPAQQASGHGEGGGLTGTVWPDQPDHATRRTSRSR